MKTAYKAAQHCGISIMNKKGKIVLRIDCSKSSAVKKIMRGTEYQAYGLMAALSEVEGV